MLCSERCAANPLYLSEVTLCPVVGQKGRDLKLCGRGMKIPLVSVFLSAGEPLRDVLPIPLYLSEVTNFQLFLLFFRRRATEKHAAHLYVLE